MSQVYFHPERNTIAVIEYNEGFDFLGLQRYELDDERGEFWLDGAPEEHGYEYIGEI